MAASKTSKNKKPTTSGITNPSYCVSTAVSDFVLTSSCVFGEMVWVAFWYEKYLWLFQVFGECFWKTGRTSTKYIYMDIFGLDFVVQQQLLESSDLVVFLLFWFIIELDTLGRKQLPSTMQKAHTLASWVAGTIGMANLAAQFYNHHFDLVSYSMKILSIVLFAIL